jgi:hypothetical protein
MENQEQLSHFRETTNKYGQVIYVPVVDVRDGMAERALAEQIIKASNRSKYIVYNQYHISRKNQNSTNDSQM